MSECVVRMEMPENCCECQLRQEDYEMGEEFCPFTGVECLSIGRQNNCPIICSIPEGHGRLVDADDLERYWLSRIALMDSCAGKGGILESVERSTLRSCIEDIGNSKTIVPADAAERSET